MEQEKKHITTEQIKIRLYEGLRTNEEKFIEDIQNQRRVEAIWVFSNLTELQIYDQETVEKSIYVGAHKYELILSETDPFKNVTSIEEFRDVSNTLIDSFNKQKFIKEQIHKNLDQLPNDHFQKNLFQKFHKEVVLALDQKTTIREHHITDEMLETAVGYKEMIREKEKVYGRQWDMESKKQKNKNNEQER